MSDDVHDVLVIGAGLSGLVAARRLAASGADVCVLEARDRVGGRTLSVPLGAGIADLGGLWITPTQDRVAALAAELDAPCTAQHREGAMVLVEHQAAPGRSRILSRLPLMPQLELAYRLRQLERLRARVPVDAPGTAHHAQPWDAISLQTWLDEHLLTGHARDMLVMLAHLHFAAEPEELSFLYFLHALNATSGLTGQAAFAGRELRFTEGAQSLSLRLAAQLAQRGARVHLRHAVTRIDQIDQHEREVHVWCGPARFRARFVILAVPPALADRIEVAPAWPGPRAALQASMPLAPVIKAALAYEQPFWRERGLSGEAYSPVGVVRAVVDHSGEAGAADESGEQPALLAFVVGAQARRLSGLAQAGRRDMIVAELVAMFGPAAGQPSAYVDQDWPGDPWSTGCVAVMPPGVLTRCHDALRAPVGRIHFAGTETAQRWPHYLDGAVEAGERAAAEILARITG